MDNPQPTGKRRRRRRKRGITQKYITRADMLAQLSKEVEGLNEGAFELCINYVDMAN
jgi:hypothetical protein